MEGRFQDWKVDWKVDRGGRELFRESRYLREKGLLPTSDKIPEDELNLHTDGEIYTGEKNF